MKKRNALFALGMLLGLAAGGCDKLKAKKHRLPGPMRKIFSILEGAPPTTTTTLAPVVPATVPVIVTTTTVALPVLVSTTTTSTVVPIPGAPDTAVIAPETTTTTTTTTLAPMNLSKEETEIFFLVKTMRGLKTVKEGVAPGAAQGWVALLFHTKNLAPYASLLQAVNGRVQQRGGSFMMDSAAIVLNSKEFASADAKPVGSTLKTFAFLMHDLEHIGGTNDSIAWNERMAAFAQPELTAAALKRKLMEQVTKEVATRSKDREAFGDWYSKLWSRWDQMPAEATRPGAPRLSARFHYYVATRYSDEYVKDVVATNIFTKAIEILNYAQSH